MACKADYLEHARPRKALEEQDQPELPWDT